VLADTLLADTDNNKEEDVNNKVEEDIDNKEEDVINKEEDVNDDKKGNEDAINNMFLKLKPAAATPPKMTVKKEPGVEKLATVVSKKLQISTPAFKPYLMKMLDGYMAKPYCQKYTDFVEVNVHIAGVLKEHACKVELSMDGLSMIWRRAIPNYFFEIKRMMDMLKGAYHPNKLCVIAHDNVV
jgi:hypothetical protein